MVGMNNRNSNSNSTRLFHWSKSFNLDAKNQDKDKNKTLKISKTHKEDPCLLSLWPPSLVIFIKLAVA
jgi:hypothetical protein